MSVLLSHLCVSICALLSRELLEDCGQTAQHKDGTGTEGKKALRLRFGTEVSNA